MFFHYYIPGLTLIAAALLIIAFPQILVALVAGLVFMAGVAALWMGNAMRNMQKRGMQAEQEGFPFFFFRNRRNW